MADATKLVRRGNLEHKQNLAGRHEDYLVIESMAVMIRLIREAQYEEAHYRLEGDIFLIALGKCSRAYNELSIAT